MPKNTPTPADELVYDPELGPGYFVQVRTDFLRSPAFSPYAKVLYEVLLSYAGEGCTAWPGQVRLAAEVGCTDRMIRKVLKTELVPAGLVSVQQIGFTRTNRYRVHKLPTLPPRGERNQVPARGRRRNQVPIRARNGIPPKAESGSHKVESAQPESAQEHGPLIQGRLTLAEYNEQYRRRS